VGITFVQIISWSIMITTAGSLHLNGITHIQTADQAAKALEPMVQSFPFAGTVSKIIFAIGIIGIGFLSIPVLAGSCGYVLADVFEWKQGLSKKFNQAKSFYLVISFATVIGLWITLINIDPIQILVYSAVINGIISGPIIISIIKIANDKKMLKDKINGKLSNILGLISVIITILPVVIMFFTKIFKL
ncbi:MAG: divalent metal cation transporter, partial [Thermoproteota archaeon]|nr:divalent metal cation transporter [Thermoproteota archaeon]